MADFVFNIAKGRVAEFYNRVDTNDPANSALVLVVGQAGSTDATLRDLDTLSAVLAATAEVTNSGYARKVLTDTDLAAFAADDANDRVDLDFADQTWTAVADIWVGRVTGCKFNPWANGHPKPLCMF
jgi:glucose-6-phosphate isomerase